MNRVFNLLKNNKILAFTYFWLLLGLSAFITYLAIFKSIDWQVLTGCATWVLAAGVFFAYVQIRETRKSTNAQIAMELFRELRSEEAVRKLRLLYDVNQMPSDIEYLPCRESINNDIDYILDRMDTLGNLVKLEIIDKMLAIETYGGPPALRLWHKYRCYIKTEQPKRGYYSENFEGFVRASVDYFTENKIDVKYYKKGEEDKPINLVTELRKPEFLPRSWKEIEKAHKNKNSLKDAVNSHPCPPFVKGE